MKRPLRVSLPILTLIALMVPARAHSQSLSVGLMAGGSLSTFTGKLAEDAKNYGGFIAGAFVHVGVAGFAVEPGVFYTQKGSKRKDQDGTDVSNRLNYIQIPLVVRIRLPMGLYVGAGPAIGVNIGCHFHAKNGTDIQDYDCDKDLGEGALAKPATTEATGIGVAGLEFGKFSLGVRADYGIGKTYKELFDNPSNPDLKTRTISAIAAIRF